MKILLHIGLGILLLSSFGCQEDKYNVNSLPQATTNANISDTMYIQQGIPWGDARFPQSGTLSSPQAVIVGNEPLVYVADTYNNRGSVYDKLGQYQHEIEDFNDAIRLNPNDALFYNNRASAYLHQGNKILGCLDLQKACAMKFCNALEWAKREGYCR